MTKRHGFQYDRIFGKKEWYIEELDFDKAEQGVSTDLYFPRYYGIKSEEHAKELCDLLNEQDQLIKILSFDCEVFIKEIERMKFILKKKFDYDIEEVVAEIYDGKTK